MLRSSTPRGSSHFSDEHTIRAVAETVDLAAGPTDSGRALNIILGPTHSHNSNVLANIHQSVTTADHRDLKLHFATSAVETQIPVSHCPGIIASTAETQLDRPVLSGKQTQYSEFAASVAGSSQHHSDFAGVSDQLRQTSVARPGFASSTVKSHVRQLHAPVQPVSISDNFVASTVPGLVAAAPTISGDGAPSAPTSTVGRVFEHPLTSTI